jgi:hypothetical protein
MTGSSSATNTFSTFGQNICPGGSVYFRIFAASGEGMSLFIHIVSNFYDTFFLVYGFNI